MSAHIRQNPDSEIRETPDCDEALPQGTVESWRD